jgi:hypothetical protein
MAITTGLCFSFKKELFEAIHDFNTDVFKAALYTSSANISPATTVYTSSGELPTGGGYTAGGLTLTGATVSLANGIAFVDFDNAVWNAANFTVNGILVYNSSKADRAVFVQNFGSVQVSTGNFVYRFPENTSTFAIIRI